MILPHQMLHLYAERYGLDWPHIGPASVDLRIGPKLLAYAPGIDRKEPYQLECMQGLWLQPGWFYLASSIENIYCDASVAGMVQMRSSFARDGLGHKMAGFVDPAFRGQITFELETARPLKITDGDRIAQLILMRLVAQTSQPYVGKYLGQQGPTERYTA